MCALVISDPQSILQSHWGSFMHNHMQSTNPAARSDENLDSHAPAESSSDLPTYHTTGFPPTTMTCGQYQDTELFAAQPGLHIQSAEDFRMNDWQPHAIVFGDNRQIQVGETCPQSSPVCSTMSLEEVLASNRVEQQYDMADSYSAVNGDWLRALPSQRIPPKHPDGLYQANSATWASYETHVGAINRARVEDTRVRPLETSTSSFSDQKSAFQHSRYLSGGIDPERLQVDTFSARSAKEPVPCPDCGQVLSTYYNFRTHQERHQGVRKKTHACVEVGCDKAFNRLADLKRHHASVHVRSKNYQCEHCQVLFPRRDSLLRHSGNACIVTANRRAQPKPRRTHRKRSSSRATGQKSKKGSRAESLASRASTSTEPRNGDIEEDRNKDSDFLLNEAIDYGGLDGAGRDEMVWEGQEQCDIGADAGGLGPSAPPSMAGQTVAGASTYLAHQPQGEGLIFDTGGPLWRPIYTRNIPN